MQRSMHFGRVRLWAAAAAILTAIAGVASAADPVRLLVELPPDVRRIEAGETVPVQVVGEDAQGNRVGFGTGRVEMSATVGTVERVSEPYAFRYASTAVSQPTTVRLRAWLKETPDISGEATLEVVPTAPYRNLVLRSPTSTPPGATVDIEILGERADGTTTRVRDQQVSLSLVDSPGRIEFVTQGIYRYVAPPEGSEAARYGAVARITGFLERYPQVRGDTSITITRSDGGAPVGGGAGGTANGPPGSPGADTPTETADTTDEDAGGVVWPSGNVRVATWRTKAAADTEWGKKRTIQSGGGAFVVADEQQRVRVVILRDDVVEVEAVQWIGEKKGAAEKRLEATKDGPYRITRNKAGQRVVHLEVAPPENRKPLHVTLHLTLNDGKVLREELTFERQAPRSR